MVLNKALYAALDAAFGEPTVYCQEEPAAYSTDALSALDRPTGVVWARGVKGGERYVVTCPFCGRRKMWFSYLAGVELPGERGILRFGQDLFICYRCLCNEDRQKRRKIWQTLKENGYDGRGGLESGVVELRGRDAEPGAVGVAMDPGDYPVAVPLTSDDCPRCVGEYLRGRGVDPAGLERALGAAWSEDPTGKGWGVGRIIFPVYQNRVLVGWQGRALDKDVDDRNPKYLNPRSCSTRNWLYNMDNARWHDPVVLVEGVFDVYQAGPAAVARFGKVTHPRQLSLLRGIWGTRSLVYIPDTNDPKATAKARDEIADWTVRELFKGGIHMVVLPRGTDPGGLPHDTICRLVKEQTGLDIP